MQEYDNKVKLYLLDELARSEAELRARAYQLRAYAKRELEETDQLYRQQNENNASQALQQAKAAEKEANFVHEEALRICREQEEQPSKPAELKLPEQVSKWTDQNIHEALEYLSKSVGWTVPNWASRLNQEDYATLADYLERPPGPIAEGKPEIAKILYLCYTALRERVKRKG